MLNVLSVDVEEYFHPTELASLIQKTAWSSMPSRVEDQMETILELFASHDVKATFFVVGWLAEGHPRLMRAIADAGHEIGTHSYSHALVYNLTPQQFRQDTIRSMNAIFDTCGVRVKAYRAPSYSITANSIWALEILVELGFTHDSSIYPIVHDRYGIPGSPRHAHIIDTLSGPICEVPIATARLPGGRVAPVGGGAYLRLFPYRYTAAGVRKINEEGEPACIYFHPWEIDPNQPRLTKGMLSTIRTYYGLRGMKQKLERLMNDFDFSTMTSVHPTESLASIQDLQSNELPVRSR